nr:oligosaccharide flippase family protein [Saprospiraceae bacterium]
VDNLDNLLIGKVFSATQLGFFVRAKSSKHMPEQILTGILQAVSFPVLTKVCDDEIEFRRLHLRFLQLSLYVYFPVIFGFIAASKAFIVVLYTSKWLPALPYLQIILLSSFAYFLGALFNQTIMAKGKAKMYFRINTAKKIIVLAAIPFGIWGGILSFVWAITIISIIRLFIDAYFVGKLMKIKIFEYLKIVLKPFIIAGLMFALVYPINFLTIKSDLLILALQIAVGLISYICFSLIFKLEEFHEVRSIIFNQISGISSKIIGKNK